MRCLRHALFPGFTVAIIMLGAGGCASVDLSESLPPPNPKPLGSIWIDPARHELIVSGFVNQVQGAVELFACGPGGKTHESILVLFGEPADIQTGLLLLGLKHGEPMKGLGQGPPEGDRVNLTVHWEQDGEVRFASAGELILDYQRGKSFRNASWVFNGSKVENNYFLALAEESLIATYWDPWAIINIATSEGRDDERLAANTKKLPPRQTPVRLVISPVHMP